MGEVDIAAVLQMVAGLATDMREMRGEMREMRGEMRGEMRDTRRDIGDLKHDVTSMRQALTEYHSAVLGHGILISELEDRIRRIERHLNLPPAAA